MQRLFTPITVGFGALLVIFHGASYVIPDFINLVSLVPANTLIVNYYVWNLFTSFFFEINPFKLLYDLFLLLIISQEISFTPADQFSLFFVFNNLASTLGSLAWVFIRFFMTSQNNYITDRMYGFGGVIMCLMMYTRQQLGSKAVIPQLPSLTFHNLPSLYFTIQTVLFLLGINMLSMDYTFTFISFFFSWSYLRFNYKYQVPYVIVYT
jgi:hypothetical protein